jgi:large-conductance mechanosensitive channel
LENIEQELQTEAQPEIQVPEEVQLPEQEKMNWGRFVLDIIETLVLAVVLFLGINTVSARVRVDGFSMIPTPLRMASLFW